MKVLLLNGSPRKGANTRLALEAMAEIFDKNGIEAVIRDVANAPVSGCMACGACRKLGQCAIDDCVNTLAAELEAADGLVLGSPVYYAAPNSTLTALCDRLFYSSGFDKTMKVGASVVCARRGGTTAAFDRLNKYFTISGMPVASASYWNNIHGAAPGEAEADEEGMQCVRILAENMSFLIRSIALGKEQYGLPPKEKPARTSFIR